MRIAQISLPLDITIMFRKLATLESENERANERVDHGETKIIDLEDELKVSKRSNQIL